MRLHQGLPERAAGAPHPTLHVEPVHPGTKFLSTTLVTSVPDPPDPHVFGPHGSGSGSISQRILLSLSKNSKKNLDFYSFVTSF